MRVKYFSIPVHDDGTVADDVNRFLSQHRIIKFKQRFVDQGSESFWAVSVQWQDGGRTSAKGSKAPAVDYREVLSAEEFQVYAKLRVALKEIAEENGIAVYRVFSNAQLAAMIEQRVTTVGSFAAIAGVGEAKVKEYGERMLSVLTAEIPVMAAAKRDDTQGNIT